MIKPIVREIKIGARVRLLGGTANLNFTCGTVVGRDGSLYYVRWDDTWWQSKHTADALKVVPIAEEFGFA